MYHHVVDDNLFICCNSSEISDKATEKVNPTYYLHNGNIIASNEPVDIFSDPIKDNDINPTYNEDGYPSQ